MFSYDQLFQAYQKDKFVLVSELHDSFSVPFLASASYEASGGFRTVMNLEKVFRNHICYNTLNFSGF